MFPNLIMVAKCFPILIKVAKIFPILTKVAKIFPMVTKAANLTKTLLCKCLDESDLLGLLLLCLAVLHEVLQDLTKRSNF